MAISDRIDIKKALVLAAAPLAALAVVAAFSTGSGAASAEQAAPSPSVTPSASPPTTTPTPTVTPSTPTATPQTKVAAAITCQHLFGPAGEDGPLLKVVTFITDSSDTVDASDVVQLREDYDDVMAEQPTASTPLDVYLTQFGDSIRPYIEDLEQGGSGSFDTSAFKAAGTAIIGECGGDDEPTAEPSEASDPEPTEETEPAEPEMSASQEQAVGTAKDYLNSSHFSKKGLIDQLEYEDFSHKDAKFAVEHIKVNWKKQAAGTAEDYLNSSHFSRSGLIEQLEYEGYTHAQAVYGVDKAGL